MRLIKTTGHRSILSGLFAKRKPIASTSILIALGLFLVSMIQETPFRWVSGAFYWFSLLLLLPDIKGRSMKQAIVILCLALPGIVISIFNLDIEVAQSALDSNTGIISLLITVGFYNISQTIGAGEDGYARGHKGLLSTWANLHFVGAIINYAAVLIFGDKLHEKRALTQTQAQVISRAFASAGFWSPLFITLAVAASFSPGYHYSEVLIYGVSMAFIAFLFSFFEFYRKESHKPFEGLSITTDILRTPLVIALAVGASVIIFPETSIIYIVTATASIYGLYIFLTKKNVNFIDTIFDRFPKHCNEVALFLSAGLLNASILGLSRTFKFDASSLSITPELCVAFMIIALTLTCIGIHPLISITIFASLTHVTSDTANMMAFSLFSTWAIGSSLSPLSGQNIGISSRYQIDAYALMRGNILYSLCLLFTASIILFFFL